MPGEPQRPPGEPIAAEEARQIVTPEEPDQNEAFAKDGVDDGNYHRERRRYKEAVLHR